MSGWCEMVNWCVVEEFDVVSLLSLVGIELCMNRCRSSVF